MSPSRRVLVVTLVIIECTLLFAAFSGAHIDKPTAGSAWYEWRQHPSPQTETAWLAEKRKMRITQTAVDSVIWLLIIAIGAAVYYVGRAQRRLR
jgi:hypothetical protein